MQTSRPKVYHQLQPSVRAHVATFKSTRTLQVLSNVEIKGQSAAPRWGVAEHVQTDGGGLSPFT